MSSACEFTPSWAQWLPAKVADLLDGVAADEALTDMGRWGIIADALADANHPSAEARLRNGIELWRAAETLEVPGHCPTTWLYGQQCVDFARADWRLHSVYGVLLVCCARTHSGHVLMQELNEYTYIVQRVMSGLLWHWCAGVGLVNRNQAGEVERMAYEVSVTASMAVDWSSAEGDFRRACTDDNVTGILHDLTLSVVDADASDIFLPEVVDQWLDSGILYGAGTALHNQSLTYNVMRAITLWELCLASRPARRPLK